MMTKKSLKAVKFLITVLVLYSSAATAQHRKPANFIPDDDMILFPIEAETTGLDDFHKKHEKELIAARRKLDYWNSQEEYAQNYGLEDAGFLDLPSPSDKEEFFRRNYLRFYTKDLEKRSNKSIQESWEKWTADDEIDAIDGVEEREKILVKSQRSETKSAITKQRSVKISKKKSMKLNIQPRLEIGMVKISLKTDYVQIRSWLGVNGNQEVKLERKFKSTGTRAMVNYYIDQSLVLAAVDQKIVKNWTFRLTHTKDIDTFSNISDSGTYENNIAQIKFNKRF